MKILKSKHLGYLLEDLFFCSCPRGYLCVMRILIDGGSLRENRLNAEKREIIFHCLDILTGKKGGADWLLWIDDSGPQNPLAGLAVEKIAAEGPMAGMLGRKLWRSRLLSSVIKRSGATLLMSFSGADAGRTPIAQCNWVSQTGSPGKAQGRVVTGPNGIPAPAVLYTFSEKDKEQLTAKSGRAAATIFVIYGGADKDFLPLPWVEREKAKIGFAAGREYFLVFFNGLRAEGLINVLKAFSLFKKRQQSNMQLVFTGTGDPGAGFREKLQSYKYREDIHIREGLPVSALSKLVAAAYVVISPFAEEATGLRVFNAFQAAVPVITSAGGCQAEVAGEAALYAAPGDPAVLSDRMMSLYKDENLRNSMISKGKIRLSAFDWERSAEKIWEGMTQSALSKFENP